MNTEAQSMVDFTDDLNITRYIFDSQSANQQGGTGKPLIGHSFLKT